VLNFRAMFNLGMGEITLILLLALIFLGPSKLPELATGLGRMIRQIRKATADVKNEIVLDDTFRKPFEELRDAVTLPAEELKRRDQLIESVRRQAEELEKTIADAGNAAVADEGKATPPPEPVAPPVKPFAARVGSGPIPMTDASWPPAPIPPPPVAPPAGTFPRSPTPVGVLVPRSPTPAPLQPGRLGGPQRVTPPISSVDANRANITQVLSEEDLMPAPKGAPPPPPPLPGVPPPPPGNKKA
jgi:Sec-independent protein translocase protein TatA